MTRGDAASVLAWQLVHGGEPFEKVRTAILTLADSSCPRDDGGLSPDAAPVELNVSASSGDVETPGTNGTSPLSDSNLADADGVAAGLADIAAGRTRPLADVRRDLAAAQPPQPVWTRDALIDAIAHHTTNRAWMVSDLADLVLSRGVGSGVNIAAAALAYAGTQDATAQACDVTDEDREMAREIVSAALGRRVDGTL